MTLTVLSDHQVQSILEGLTADRLIDFSSVLSAALHQYSTNSQPGPDGPYQQPRRIKTFHHATQATSLYMPSCGPEGMGCKSSFSIGCEDAQDSNEGSKAIAPVGVLNLFSPAGEPVGLIHAKTLTAFRTALASLCLVMRRRKFERILVFGAGTQAYWHLRLALMVRGTSVRKVYVSNRNFTGAASLLRRLAALPDEVKQREGWSGTEFAVITPSFHDFERLLNDYVFNADIIYCCTPSREQLFDGGVLTSHDGRRKGRLIIAVGSLTPDMRELPHGLLVQATKKHDSATRRHFHKHADHGGVVIVDSLDGALHEAGEIVAANIQPTQLVELGELVMLRQIDNQESESETESTPATPRTQSDTPDEMPATSLSSPASSRPPSPSRGKHDSRTSSSTSLGRLPFRKSASSSTIPSHKSHQHGHAAKDETALSRWLRDGTVIYKSVGLGMMDLVVGNELMKLAEERDIGTRIPDF
ncbi:Ornithine cyclodeaminase/mu-crystallin family [Geosmithia morbida]|uniref:Ornithine cyclodeaminase/mu-crystallin family n=1 Tax=Geosmithia morbida TaxID=1094350 RepID=A0A9P4YW03_9HYPO|nr:Ornithine cyclodeaminase/mu-crystallin family [Geosmithia morbida]KAF4122827.1 Ornithine cyclodeaminase/mu-crystallin family [Geosmithia morbida]